MLVTEEEKWEANFFKYIAKFGIHRIYTFRIYISDEKKEVGGACLAYLVQERSEIPSSTTESRYPFQYVHLGLSYQR
jgi:hypothetical protein